MSKVKITSCLFMGLAHILYLKQYLKGIIFALIEIMFLINLPIIFTNLYNLVTLGTENKTVPLLERDNSIYMLFDGIVTIIIALIFIGIYIASVKDAKKTTKFRLNDTFPVLGLIPAVALIIFFVVVPLIFSASVAFTNYSAPNHIPPNNTVDWVGLDNFIELFAGGQAWSTALGRVAIWTIIWAFLATTTTFFGGFIIAVLLKESKIKIAPFFRSIFILPYAVPAVLSMLVWQNLLNGSFGIVNRTLMELGLITQAIPWLSDPLLAKFTVVIINLWAGFSYFMMLTTGSMTAVPSDIYEASEIDGANKFQTFFKITMPLVMFQTMPLIIMSFSHNINNFGAIFFLSGGGPTVADTTTTAAGGTDILISWIYNLTINLQQYQFGAAIAVIIFIVLAPFAIFNFKNTKSFKDGEL